MADLHPESLVFSVPPEQEAGAYANAFTIWHTPYDFTIDFAATQYPEPSDPDDAESRPVADARVVARVRIPPTLAFDLIQMINRRMATYEANWGEIVVPEPRREEDG
jgi:hypothetical protein